ncbi:MAG: glycosyltransferase [Planctomycetota bacterium]
MRHRATRLVHILEGFLGGTSTYLCNVLPQLVHKGFDVILICSLNRDCPDAVSRLSRLRQSGVRVHIIPMYRQISLLKDIRSFLAILSLLVKYKPDIVHTHCSKAGALGRIAVLLTGRRVMVHSPHCFAFLRCNTWYKKLLFRLAEKLLGKLTTKLVAVSASEAEVAIRSRIVPAERCVWIRNGLPNRWSFPEDNDVPSRVWLGIGKETRVVVTACRLVEYKGIFRFIRAAEISRARNVLFLLVGDGELRATAQKYILEHGLSDKVRLVGYVSNMDRIYAVSDVIVLCSDAEAQPYLLLEAMRAKRPIVATSVIGNNELISRGQRGLLAKPTPSGVAGAVDTLLADSEKRNEYARHAYAYFCRHHLLKNQISELVETYNGCICNGHG